MRVPSLKLVVLPKLREALFLVLSFVCVQSCFAITSQHEAFTNAVPFDNCNLVLVPGLDTQKATLTNPASAKALITAMHRVETTTGDSAGKDSLPTLSAKPSGAYVLINLASWDGAANGKILANHWYLYQDIGPGKWSQEDFTTTDRLLGIKKLYVLSLQFNAKSIMNDSAISFIPDYDITITKKTPTNITHLYELLSAFAGGTTAADAKVSPVSLDGDRTEGCSSDLMDVWSGGVLNIQYNPSDITIKSTFRRLPSDSEQKLADDITLDNEGLYYWDVTFAVPVKKVSQIQFDSTSGTATPANVSNTTVFAVLDGYFPPTDIKSGGFRFIPHPIGGVAFAKQPLSKILIGGAWGPKPSELYIGALFVKQPILSGNTSCSNASGATETGKTHYCAQFSIGINVSISSIASKLGARQ